MLLGPLPFDCSRDSAQLVQLYCSSPGTLLMGPNWTWGGGPPNLQWDAGGIQALPRWGEIIVKNEK